MFDEINQELEFLENMIEDEEDKFVEEILEFLKDIV
jgi:hypothetical protein